MARPALKPDGSEGTGTLKLTYQIDNEFKEEKTRTINGCFVKNDENLQRFIPTHINPSADMVQFNKNRYSFYFFYTFDGNNSELNLVSATITYYRYSKSNKEKTCELLENPQIFKDNKHAFLLCDSKYLNECNFLEKHSKRVLVHQSLDVTENVFGLQVSQDQDIKPKIKFIPFKISKCESNMYSCIDDSCYAKLGGTSPILLPYGKENVVAGGYRKTDNGRISISIFGQNQDEKSKDFSDGSGKGRVNEEKGNDSEESKIDEAASSHPEEHSDSEENGNNSPEQERKKGKGNEVETSKENKNVSHSEDPDSEGTDGMLSKHEKKKVGESEGGTSKVKDGTLQSEEHSGKTDSKSAKQIDKIPSVICQPSDHEGLSSPQGGFEEQAKANFKSSSVTKLLNQFAVRGNQEPEDPLKTIEASLPEGKDTKIPKSNPGNKSTNEEDLSYSKEESEPEDPLKTIEASLPEGQGHLNDNIGKDKNVKKYRRFLLYLALNGLSMKWQEVGQNLGIKQNQLDTIKIDCSAAEGGAREQAYQMLVHWRQSSKNPTLRLLLKALIEAEMVEQAMKITVTGVAVLQEGNNKSHYGVPVKEKLLNDITRDIKNDWKFLGRYLILDENQIQSIKMENPLSTHEQAHEMLFKWKQKYARRATTRVLIKALEDVDKRPVADRVREWEKQCFQPVTRK